MKNPIQPIIKDEHGVPRFKKNELVDVLLDWAQERGFGLNEIARINFSNDDRQQFAQLIGYSLDGYSSLSYVDDDAYCVADRMFEHEETEEQARINDLQEKLDAVRIAMREPIAALYGIHPDNLLEVDDD